MLWLGPSSLLDAALIRRGRKGHVSDSVLSPERRNQNLKATGKSSSLVPGVTQCSDPNLTLVAGPQSRKPCFSTQQNGRISLDLTFFEIVLPNNLYIDRNPTRGHDATAHPKQDDGSRSSTLNVAVAYFQAPHKVTITVTISLSFSGDRDDSGIAWSVAFDVFTNNDRHLERSIFQEFELSSILSTVHNFRGDYERWISLNGVVCSTMLFSHLMKYLSWQMSCCGILRAPVPRETLLGRERSLFALPRSSSWERAADEPGVQREINRLTICVCRSITRRWDSLGTVLGSINPCIGTILGRT